MSADVTEAVVTAEFDWSKEKYAEGSHFVSELEKLTYINNGTTLLIFAIREGEGKFGPQYYVDFSGPDGEKKTVGFKKGVEERDDRLERLKATLSSSGEPIKVRLTKIGRRYDLKDQQPVSQQPVAREQLHRSIGGALVNVRAEFPDITISKIRFLEAEGLIHPERTLSGYRKFYEKDVDRLKSILRMQRDEYLPLKIIKDRLLEQVPPSTVREVVQGS
jgi:hypothetical protein